MFLGRLILCVCLLHALTSCTSENSDTSKFSPDDFTPTQPTPPPDDTPKEPPTTKPPTTQPTKPKTIDKDRMIDISKILLKTSVASSIQLTNLADDEQTIAQKLAGEMFKCGFDANGPKCLDNRFESFDEYFLEDQLIYVHHLAIGHGTINDQFLLTLRLSEVESPRISQFDFYLVKNNFIAPETHSDLGRYQRLGSVAIDDDFHGQINGRLTDEPTLEELYYLLRLLIEKQGTTDVVKNRLRSIIHENRELFAEDNVPFRYALLEMFDVTLEASENQLEEVAQRIYDIDEEGSDSQLISSGYLLQLHPTNRDYKGHALNALSHTNWFSRMAALEGLSAVEGLREKEQLKIMQRIDDANKKVARQAYNMTLKYKLNLGLTKQLDSLMDAKNEKTRDFVIYILGKSDYTRAAGVLVDHLADDSPTLAARIQKHLETHAGLENYRRDLIKHFKNKDPEVRYLVAKTLPFFNKTYNCKKALQAVKEQMVLEAKIDVFPNTTRKLKTQLEDTQNRLQLKCPH